MKRENDDAPTDRLQNSQPPQQTPDVSDDGAMETMLRADALAYQHNHIDNNDFADQVMTRVRLMPAPVAIRMTSTSVGRRIGIVSAFALVGAVVVFGIGAGNNLLIDAVMDLATQTITPAAFAMMLIVF